MPTAGMSSGGMGSGMSAGMQSVPVGNVPGVGNVGSVANVGNVGPMSGPGPSQGMVQSQMQQHPQVTYLEIFDLFIKCLSSILLLN